MSGPWVIYAVACGRLPPPAGPAWPVTLPTTQIPAGRYCFDASVARLVGEGTPANRCAAGDRAATCARGRSRCWSTSAPTCESSAVRRVVSFRLSSRPTNRFGLDSPSARLRPGWGLSAVEAVGARCCLSEPACARISRLRLVAIRLARVVAASTSTITAATGRWRSRARSGFAGARNEARASRR